MPQNVLAAKKQKSSAYNENIVCECHLGVRRPNYKGHGSEHHVFV